MKQTNSRPIFFLFTCVKNGRPYIQRLFNSLLNQTVYNFVHFIYDDGSEDPIEDLVCDYKDKAHFDVIYERNSKNIGLNLATKHCIEKCFLPFFIWIDCDNWVDSCFFEKLEDLHKKHKKAVVLRTTRFLVDTSGNIHTVENNKLYDSSLKAKKNYDHYLLFGNFYFSFFAVSNCEYKKYNSTLFFLNERSFFNDQQVLFVCSKSKQRFVYSDTAIGYCMIRSDSESATNYSDNKNALVDYYKILNDRLHINSLNYTDVKRCLDLQKRHNDLFLNHDYILAKKVLSEKRKLFAKNKISNKVLPFCDNSLFSVVYYFFPKLAFTIYNNLIKNKQ